MFLMIVYSLAFGHFLYWALRIQYLAGSIVRCASAQPVSLLYCAYIYFHSVHYIQLSLNMFDHPSLVSLLFAVLVSLHPVTFSMFFITCSCKFF